MSKPGCNCGKNRAIISSSNNSTAQSRPIQSTPNPVASRPIQSTQHPVQSRPIQSTPPPVASSPNIAAAQSRSIYNTSAAQASLNYQKINNIRNMSASVKMAGGLIKK